MNAEKLQVHRGGARKNPRQPGSMASRHWLAILLSLCALGVAAFFSAGIFSRIGSTNSVSLASPDNAPPTMSLGQRQIRWCKRLVFDNDNSRVLETKVPCDGETLDANGDPVPTGTTNRLNAISKSFSGR